VNPDDVYQSVRTKKSSKMDDRHRSSEPKSNENPSEGYGNENVGFHVLSPQPQKTSLLPRIQRLRDKGKKTLILDLDETLVHSTFDKINNADIELPVNFDGTDSVVYVKIRPRVLDFLRKITKYYEVVIFTASVANYADPLIDLLDSNKYGFYKLFREHCTYNGNYIKDLSKLGREMKDCIIVDNLPKSYANQPENGIPILSW
jgi:RNA polymerase II subunit A small phosphatase-like protein